MFKLKNVIVLLSAVLIVLFTSPLWGDECMEGDCEDGIGTGFTESNKIYEGEWKDGMPHGSGKLYVSKDKVIEGIWEKGKLVEEKKPKKDKKSSPDF